jgi:hypothetical protein
MRDTASELAYRLHLLRLAQRFLDILASLILRLELARALLDGLLQRLGEGAQLNERALALGYVDVHADDARGPTFRVVKVEAARLDPRERVVARAYDAEFGKRLPVVVRECALS